MPSSFTSHGFGSQTEEDQVIISGLAGVYPNCANSKEFLERLLNKEDCCIFDYSLSDPELPPNRGRVQNYDQFDNIFFGVSRKRAQHMDILLRVMLERAYEAIFDAGLHPDDIRGSNTGVFAGSFVSDKANFNYTLRERDAYIPLGNMRNMLANHISYALGINGPSFTCDTACSSGMYAFETGYRAIIEGRCDTAIICSASLHLNPKITLHFKSLGVLNQGTGCRPFDDGATGYTRADAFVAIVLQKLKNANRVYAKVVHSKTNSDGYKEMGITFPSADAQAALLMEVFEEANVDPDSIAFVEAHGTGTIVGDPAELKAIDKCFKRTVENPLLIGSNKGNIGHTEPSSGLCSISKVLFMFNFDTFIPNIHYDKPRKGVDALVEGRMKVVTEIATLPEDARLISVNSFGFGGANGNVILEKFEKIGDKVACNIPRLVCFSGRTLESVRHIQKELQSKSLNVSGIRLLQEIFRKPIPQHYYRSYVIFKEKDTRIVDTYCFNMAERPMALLIGACSEYPLETVNEFLKIPSLFNTLKEITAICHNNGIKINPNGNSDIPFHLILQIGFINLLVKDLNLTFKFVRGSGNFGEIVSAYAKEQLSLQEAIMSAAMMSKNEISIDKILQKIPGKQLPTFKEEKLDFLKNENCFIVNMDDSNSMCSDLRLISPKGNLDDLLEGIGRLYLEGYYPHLGNLYTDITLPVGRGTSLISPSIKWKPCSHDVTYQVCQPGYAAVSLEMAVTMLQFYEGHVIDERLLFPATGYLYYLWIKFGETQMKTIYDMCTVFENVKFHKATHFEPNAAIEIHFMIHTDGLFEISVKNSVVVTGFIRNASQWDRSEQFHRQTNVERQEFLLSTKDVYKELRLRGYNYRGKFKSIHQVGPKAALIKWEQNWVTFLDNMLQMAILQSDSRNLYVPVGIERLYIDCESHTKEMKAIEPEKSFITVLNAAGSKSLGSKYVDIRGIQVRSIQKKKQILQPILETNRFIPNDCECSLEESIRINLQLLLECQPTLSFKSVELLPNGFKVHNVDEEQNECVPSISSLICNAIADIPLVSPDLMVVSKTVGLEVDNVRVESKMTKENMLFVAHSASVLDEAFDATTSNGFVLCMSSDDALEDSRFVLLTKHKVTHQTYVYFFWKKVAVESDREFINFFKMNDIQICLAKIQKALETRKEVILISEQVDQSGILGFMNCLRLEPGGTKARCVFLMDSHAKFDAKNAFFQRQLAKGLPINVLKDNKWGTYRHLLLSNLSEIPCDHVYANSERFGDLASLKWRQGPLTKNSTCTNVAFSALNFRDLMLAYGKITPDSITRNRFLQNFVQGMEFSGIKSNGEKIFGASKGTITNMIQESDLEVKVPEGWTLEDAATVLVVYLTCIYALKTRANIRKGQSILIHSGCGGIGLAAINMCIYYECNIFVTVGTEEKREYLIKNYPNIKTSHIGNSRDKSFKQMILKETQGRGVDLVLNSLAEDKLRASVECLSRDGIFLEIGKFDLEMNNNLPLDFINRGCAYESIIFGESLSDADRALCKDLLLQAIKDGYVRPIPRTLFKMNELEEAFRFMATGKHIGKVLIKIDQKADTLFGLPRYFCKSKKSYIVFGGLGGFGLELCDWLVMRGAKNLIISSRKGIQSGYQKYRINTWQNYGVNVSVNTDDALTEEGCRKILCEANNLGPVDGIFNLAVVLKDCLLENQTAESMLLSYGPKALLTQHLDKLSRKMCPELGKFVVFSSVSCGRGNAGQCNYAHSNSVMERICEIRQRDGLPALAIQWGAVGDVGLLEDLQRENNEIAIGGTLQQKVANCLEVFDKLIQQPEPIVSSMIVAEKFGLVGHNDPVQSVAKILGLKSIKSISKHSLLSELGMDSLMSAEIKQMLEGDFNIVLNANDIRTLTFSKLEDLVACSELKPAEDEFADEFTFKMIASSLQMMRTNEKVLGINEDAQQNLVLGFPGFEGISASFTALAKATGAQLKFPHYNIIGNEAENTIDSIALVFFEAFKEEVLRNGTFRIVCYSYGCLPALKLASDLENNLGISGVIVFIDAAPLLMKQMLESMKFQNVEDFETRFLEFISDKLFPNDHGKLKDIEKDLQELPTFSERMKFLQGKSELFSNELSDKDDLDQVLSAMYRRLKSVQNVKIVSLETKLKSKVFLYRVKAKNTSISDDYDLSKWCEKVTVKTFNGNHRTILEDVDMLGNLKIDLNL